MYSHSNDFLTNFKKALTVSRLPQEADSAPY